MTRIQPVRGPIVRRAVAPFAALALLLGAAAALPPAPAPAQEQAATATPFRPVAVVNDSAVTAFDVEQRARLLRLLGFPAASVEALQGAALNALVEDRIKLQEAARIGIEPDDELLAEGLATLSSRLQVTPAELETLAANQGITGASLRDFVAANMAWRSVVRSRFASRIQPGEAEIDREFALGTAADQVDYRLQEIGLPVGQNRGPEATLRLAERIRTEATTTEAFAEAARRHSRTSTAEAGGEVGWMSASELPPELQEALAEIGPGQVSRPIQVPGGVSLIRMMDRRGFSGDSSANDPAAREAVRERLVAEQSDRLAEGLLQELKRDALIELR